MKKTLSLLVLLLSLTACSSYSDSFVRRYSHEDCDCGNESIIVFPYSKGTFCFVANGIVRQIVYPQYYDDYLEYDLFLKELLKGNLNIEVGTKSRILRYDLLPPLIVKRVIKEYLKEDASYSVLRFKNRLDTEKELGIVKMMFDNGFCVFWDDYSAEYCFLSPSRL